MSDEGKTVKRSGYVYNKRTKKGFERMRKHGIVMPPFRIEDTVTRLLTSHYDRLLQKLAQAARGAQQLERAVNDTSYKTYSKITTDSVYSEIVGQLQNALIKAISADKTKLAKQIRTQLGLAKKHFFDDFIEDAGEVVGIRVQFALDKDLVFQQKIDGLQEHYLKSALDRITWEENFLKSAFLQELTSYAMGTAKDLSALTDVINAMKKTSVHDARFFARDQFSKFNSALTISSIEQAGASHVKWMSTHDGRVRPTHKALDGKLFPINDIPEEKWDYGCRCGLFPVFDV